MAQNSFINALRSDPDNIPVKQLLAASLLSDNQLAYGKNLLDQILAEGDPERNQSEIHWARRELARLLFKTGSYANFRKALELIEQNAPQREKLSGKDLALWVALSAKRPESASWTGAINLLEQVEKERELTDDEKFMKAALYEKYDELWPQVRQIVTDILTRRSGDPQIIENWVGWLLKHGDLEQAQVWKRNLPQGSVTRIRVEVHALAKQGQHAQAVQQLTALAPKELNNLQEYALQAAIASMAEELGQYHKDYHQFAENLLRSLAKKEPKQILRLATVMGLHGNVTKIQKALEMCFAAKQYDVRPASSAAVVLAILRAHPELWQTELAASVERAEQWLDRELAANPTDFALKTRVAEFHDMRGHLDRVESEYREILEKAGRLNPLERGMILNNLAYVMALNNKTDQPSELIGEAIQLLGPSGDLIDTRGYVRLVSGELGQAVADFQQAVGAGARTAHKLFHLVLALDKQGNLQEAGKYWQEAQSSGLDVYRLPPALRDDFERLRTKYGDGSRPQT